MRKNLDRLFSPNRHCSCLNYFKSKWRPTKYPSESNNNIKYNGGLDYENKIIYIIRSAIGYN